MALIIEDGTAKDDAESYVGLAEANDYIAKWVADPSDWEALADAAKENKLRQASAFVDAAFVRRWKGYPTTGTQALQWPRQYAYDQLGNNLLGIIPQQLRRAVCVVAAAAAANPTTPLGGASTIGSQAIIETEVEVGPIKRRQKFAEPSALSEGGFPKQGAASGVMGIVSAMLAPLLLSAGAGQAVRG